MGNATPNYRPIGVVAALGARSGTVAERAHRNGQQRSPFRRHVSVCVRDARRRPIKKEQKPQSMCFFRKTMRSQRSILLKRQVDAANE